MERNISVAIPYYNNSSFMEKTLETLINDERINEIVITDDKSSDISVLEDILKKKNCSKIKLFENKKNMGCYHNKIATVTKCTNEWCILLDSDNYIEKDYLDILFAINSWEKNTIYIPDIAITFPGIPSKNLDYRKYADQYITKENYINNFNDINFQCLINNCNYFLPCKEFVLCMKDGFNTYNRNFIDCLDSAVLFTDWICKNRIKVVKDLKYYHRLHPNSNYARGSSRRYEASVKAQLISKIKLNM